MNIEFIKPNSNREIEKGISEKTFDEIDGNKQFIERLKNFADKFVYIIGDKNDLNDSEIFNLVELKENLNNINKIFFGLHKALNELDLRIQSSSVYNEDLMIRLDRLLEQNQIIVEIINKLWNNSTLLYNYKDKEVPNKNEILKIMGENIDIKKIIYSNFFKRCMELKNILNNKN